MNIRFYPDYKSKSKQVSLHLYVSGKGFKTIKKVLFRIYPDLWDSDQSKLKPKHPGALQLNGYLMRIRSDFMANTPNFMMAVNKDEAIRQWIDLVLGIEKTEQLEELQPEVSTSVELDQPKPFIDIARDFMASKRPVSTPTTMKSFRLLFNMLNEFQKTKKKQMSIDGFDKRMYEELRNWMIDKEFLNNTIAKRFKLLKTFLHWAQSEGYKIHHDIKTYSYSQDEIENIALTKEEVKALIDFDFSDKPHLSAIRDIFVFGCMTGVRYSDLAAFRHQDVSNGIWRLRTTKTKDPIEIPLLPAAQTIIERYKDQGKLPVLHNQPFNRELKEMAKLAGITGEFKKVHYTGSTRKETVKQRWELVTTHTARRTFITVSIHAGLEDSLIMKISGIKNYATLNKYLKVTKEDKAAAIAKVWG